MNINDQYKKAADVISKAGGTPLPVTDTLIELLTYFIKEDEVDFIAAFTDKKSQTMDQLKASSNLSEEEILKKVTGLAKRGVIFNQPNSKGVMIYKLLPLMNVGTFEYYFMGKLEINDESKKISALFSRLLDELKTMVQENYDTLVPFLLTIPPIDRTVPLLDNQPKNEKVKIIINENLGAAVDRIVPSQHVEDLIGKFDEIALGHCFCRHHKDVEGHPCQQTKERENCFSFGKSARFTSEQGFSRMVTKEEALKVLKRAEADGLVHKAYHPNFDTSKEETSICNCCSCCCGNSIAKMIAPITNATHYLAVVDTDQCIGCGTCVKKCHTGAAFLNEDQKAQRNPDRCIGCGICAHFCPVNAISMLEGERIVRIAPPRPAINKTLLY
ncbi:MAG: 4Fe-4S binding protein [Smithella sp.]